MKNLKREFDKLDESENVDAKKPASKPKIVNLFEDMNPHKHNAKSYKKMVGDVPDKQKSEKSED